jgi:arylsulfatase A-like enzyme
VFAGTLDENFYGSQDLVTPNIDKLAATGVRFTQAYAHLCCPERAALLTGRHPQRGGVTDWMQGSMNGPKGRNMALEEVTLAEVLRDAGYRTGLFGKWHLGAHPDHGPEKAGFDEFFGIRGGFIDNFNHHLVVSSPTATCPAATTSGSWVRRRNACAEEFLQLPNFPQEARAKPYRNSLWPQ